MHDKQSKKSKLKIKKSYCLELIIILAMIFDISSASVISDSIFFLSIPSIVSRIRQSQYLASLADLSAIKK